MDTIYILTVKSKIEFASYALENVYKFLVIEYDIEDHELLCLEKMKKYFKLQANKFNREGIDFFVVDPYAEYVITKTKVI